MCTKSNFAHKIRAHRTRLSSARHAVIDIQTQLIPIWCSMCARRSHNMGLLCVVPDSLLRMPICSVAINIPRTIKLKLCGLYGVTQQGVYYGATKYCTHVSKFISIHLITFFYKYTNIAFKKSTSALYCNSTVYFADENGSHSTLMLRHLK